MVNLRAVANNITRAINPNNSATLYTSVGFQIVNFVQIPAYTAAPVTAQVQPLSTGDIRHLDALNIQGAEKKLFLNGAMLGIIRIKQRGGDLIVFPDGTLPEGNTWLVKANLEQWQGKTWCMVAVALQDDVVIIPSGGLTTDLRNPKNIVVVPAVLTGV